MFWSSKTYGSPAIREESSFWSNVGDESTHSRKMVGFSASGAFLTSCWTHNLACSRNAMLVAITTSASLAGVWFNNSFARLKVLAWILPVLMCRILFFCMWYVYIRTVYYIYIRQWPGELNSVENQCVNSSRSHCYVILYVIYALKWTKAEIHFC